MRALVYSGSLQYIEDHPVPVPGEDEALIRVRLAGICNTDLEIVRGYMGFRGIPGHEFVGTVEQCDDGRLIGKRVAGEINIGCGSCDQCRKGLAVHCPSRSVLGILNKDGAFADYLTLPVRNLHEIPGSVSDEEAVFIEPLAAAFEILEQTGISSSHSVCVLGDGKLGNLTGQVIASTGCDLTVIGKHREKLDILDSMGIRTLMYQDMTGKETGKFDIVVDCTGSRNGIEAALNMVRPRGTVVLKTTLAEPAGFNMNQIVINEITLIGSRCGPFSAAIDAIGKGVVDLRPLPARRFALSDGLEGFRYALEKRAMKVVLTAD